MKKPPTGTSAVMTRRQITALAKRITDDLFADASAGKLAARLVLENPGKPLDGPGWCHSAVYDRVRNKITRALKPKTKP